MTIRIGVIGCGGRMGRLLLRTILEDRNCRLSGGVEQARSPEVGQDLGRLAGLDAVGLRSTSDARLLVEEVTTPYALFSLGLCAVVAWLAPTCQRFLEKLNGWKVAGGFILLVISVAEMSRQGFNPFLYFQF